MKIHIMSDMHFEFHIDNGRYFSKQISSIGDVLVVAGDLCSYSGLEQAISLLIRAYGSKPIIFVAGNHSYYGSSPREVDQIRRRLADRFPNFHWLDESAAEVAGQRFLGGTLWFEETAGRSNYLSDFRAIREFTPWVYEKCESTKAYLAREVRATDVVVTHHLPSLRSVAKKFEGDPLNCFFVCDVEPVIVERQPRLWVHGHTHASCGYRIGETRVVCNPYGYDGRDTNPEFVRDLIVEVA